MDSLFKDLPLEISFHIIAIEPELFILPICKYVRDKFRQTSTYQIIKTQWNKREIFYKGVEKKDWGLVKFILGPSYQPDLEWAYYHLFIQGYMTLLPKEYVHFDKGFNSTGEMLNSLATLKEFNQKYTISLHGKEYKHITRYDFITSIYDEMYRCRKRIYFFYLMKEYVPFMMWYVEYRRTRGGKKIFLTRTELYHLRLNRLLNYGWQVKITYLYKNFMYRNRERDLYRKFLDNHERALEIIEIIEKRQNIEKIEQIENRQISVKSSINLILLTGVLMGVALYKKFWRT